MVTESTDRGIAGTCLTSCTSGGTLLVSAELARPGVPWRVLRGSQVCPAVLGRRRLTNSSELPKPSAGVNHDQPDAPSSITWRAMRLPVAGAGVPGTLMLNVLAPTLLMVKMALYS